jgi:hypothetical protein
MRLLLHTLLIALFVIKTTFLRLASVSVLRQNAYSLHPNQYIYSLSPAIFVDWAHMSTHLTRMTEGEYIFRNVVLYKSKAIGIVQKVNHCICML